MATKPLQVDDEGRVMDEQTRKNQKAYEAYEREQSDAQRRLEERDKSMIENARKLKEKVKSILPFKKGGVAKTVTKEMEYDYKTGKKSFAGTTQQRDAHAEKEGKRVAKDLAYDKAMGMKHGGKVSSASKRADGIAIRGKTRA